MSEGKTIISDEHVLNLIKEQAAQGEAVRKISSTLERVEDALNKIAALEAHHLDTKASVGRAFDALAIERKHIDELSEAYEKTNQELHSWLPMLKNFRRLLYAASTAIVTSGIGALAYSIFH